LTDLLHTHTQCYFGQDFYTDMPHCDLQMTFSNLNHCIFFIGVSILLLDYQKKSSIRDRCTEKCWNLNKNR